MMYCIYNPKTGLFTGRRIRCSTEKAAALNLPPDLAMILGDYDHLSQRVDIKSGVVIDYRPPAPDDDHQWVESAKRWQLKPSVAARRREQANAKDLIAQLEQKQLRPQRELALDPDNAEAKRRMADIEAEITLLRAKLA